MSRFADSVQKSIQAVAVLVKIHEGRMDKIRLLKLLYIADRESLTERGMPIVGGMLCAMDNGPLHSAVYNLIKQEHPKSAEWGQFFKTEGENSVVMTGDPGELDLSPYETEKLTEIAKRFSEVRNWALVDHTHTFQEWIQCRPTQGSSSVIPPETLLAALGFTAEEIKKIVSEANSYAALRRSIRG